MFTLVYPAHSQHMTGNRAPGPPGGRGRSRESRGSSCSNFFMPHGHILRRTSLWADLIDTSGGDVALRCHIDASGLTTTQLGSQLHLRTLLFHSDSTRRKQRARHTEDRRNIAREQNGE